VLQEQATAALAAGARARAELGDAVARLLDAAAEERASLLLLGWSLKRIFPGRFVGRLLRRAPCPVVIIPPGAPRR
jgi:nucleotide-binding universal stress UspA family protein